jgi:hypothetical protein
MVRDKQKFGDAEQIFTELTRADTAAMDLVNDVLQPFQIAIGKIRSDYDSGERLQKEFLNDVGNIMNRLEQQLDELRSLRKEYLSLSGSIVSA